MRGSSVSTSTARTPSSKPPERAKYPRNRAHSHPQANKSNLGQCKDARYFCETSFSPDPRHHLLLPYSPKYREGDVTLFALNLYNVTQHLQLPNYLSSKHVDQYLLLPHGKENILSR